MSPGSRIFGYMGSAESFSQSTNPQNGVPVSHMRTLANGVAFVRTALAKQSRQGKEFFPSSSQAIHPCVRWPHCGHTWIRLQAREGRRQDYKILP